MRIIAKADARVYNIEVKKGANEVSAMVADTLRNAGLLIEQPKKEVVKKAPKKVTKKAKRKVSKKK